MITPEQALAIYHAGPDAVVKVICESSRQVDLLQERVEMLERKVAQLSKERQGRLRVHHNSRHGANQ